MIGQTISHYKILEKLGEGGMGIVYKAEDIQLDRLVALKFLPSHLAASEQDKARFILEAKAASAINHPNICTIYSIDEHEGKLFIVMEFVDGRTLRDLTGGSHEAPLQMKRAIDIAIQIADGLAAAHEKGIVHRDIKPENIMIRKDGIAQIMDFGLAKLRASGSKITRLTKEGSTVGTAGYMSPEQVQGQDTDHRSDIFSYGVLLYELLTGQLPFKGVHETALAYEIVNVDPAPMSSITPEIDSSLDAIVLECLEKDVNERAQGMKQISVDLKKYKRESSRQRVSRVTAARPVINIARSAGVEAPRGSSWKQSAGYILSVLLLIILMVVLWGPLRTESSATRPVVHSSIDLPPDAPVANSSLVMSVSPDGKYIAYQSPSGQIWLHKMNQPGSRPIPGAIGTEPAFSPDGKSIAFYSGSGISKVSLAGSAPEEICSVQTYPPGLCWTADNTIIFGTYSGPLFRVPINGGTPAPITALDSSSGEISHRVPQLLPGGKAVIFTAKTKDMASFNDALIVAERLDNGERKVLVRGGAYGTYIPAGYLIYARDKSILAVQFDPDRLEVTGSPVPIEQGGVVNNAGSSCFGVSENGIFVFSPPSAYADQNTVSIGWIDRNGRTYPLCDTLRNFNAAALSPDGRRLAAGISAANDDIWIYDISRSLLSRFTFGWGNNNNPVWSRDGRYVIYCAEKGQIANIYRKPWDGNGAEERLTTGPNPQYPVSIAPGDRFISFDENDDIWILPADSSKKGGFGKPYPFIQSPATESGGSFSPDGKWMAYTSNESGKSEVYVVAFPGGKGKWQISNGGGNGGAFSRDGKELFYANGNILMGVDVKTANTFDFSLPRKVIGIPQGFQLQDITLDGKRILTLVQHSHNDSLSRLEVVTEWFDEVKTKFADIRN